MKILNVQFSEQIGRKAVKGETTAPLPCESPFFQLPSTDLYFFLRAFEPEILTLKGGSLDIPIYANTKYLCKIGRDEAPLTCIFGISMQLAT